MKLDSKVTQSQTFLSLPLLRTISQIQRSEKEKVWKLDENPVDVLPFTADTGPTSGVAAIDFLYLMFPEELFEHVVLEQIATQECLTAKPDSEWFETTHRNESIRWTACTFWNKAVACNSSLLEHWPSYWSNSRPKSHVEKSFQ